RTASLWTPASAVSMMRDRCSARRSRTARCAGFPPSSSCRLLRLAVRRSALSVPQVPAAPQGAVSTTAPPQRRKVALLGLLALVLSLFVATPASTQQVTPDGCDTIDRHINLY